MNVLRTLANRLWNTFETKAAQPEAGAHTLDVVREQRVPAVLGLSRFRDGFEQLPLPNDTRRPGQPRILRPLPPEPPASFGPAMTNAPRVVMHRDGFDAGVSARVDLHGGLRSPPSAPNHASRTEARAPLFGFSASLDQLAALL